MSTFRRRIGLVAIATLNIQTAVLLLAAAPMCWAEHMHGGRPVIDCPAHHQPSPSPESPHAHHGGSAPQADESSGRARLQCDCSADLQTFLIGETGLLVPLGALAPPDATGPLTTLSGTAAPRGSRWPLSPPPRPRLS